MHKRLALAAIVLLALAPGLAGSTIALSFTGGTTYAYVTEPLPNTIGWAFTLSSPIIVSRLGFYDVGGDGLVTSHAIAIWDSAMTIVASGTVSGADPLISGFRWSDIAPVALAPGSYRIGAMINNDDHYYSEAASILTAAGVTYDFGVYHLGGFAFPEGTSYTSMGRFGPNFAFDPVPEPGAFGLIALGLGGIALLRLRRK